jgi:D-glycerate 3-kinase
MNKAQLTRFIEHYQRITEHTLQELPKTADIVFTLNKQQQITHRNNKHELNTDE